MSINGEMNRYHDVEHLIETPFCMQPGERLRVQAKPVGESKTIQADADACDINKIIARYEKTGFLPPVMKQGVYDDVSALNRDLTELVAESVVAMRSYSDYLEAARVKAEQKPETLPTDQPASAVEAKPSS